MKKAACASRVIWVSIILAMITGCAGVMQPTAKVTSNGGPDIQQATLEPYDGPKARLAVSRFVVKAAKAQGTIGDGLADMLATALFQTNRYIVLERQALGDVLAEQDLGASGRIRQETAAKIGQIEGAELLVMGTVTEFEPGSAGAGASAGASVGGTVGSVAGVPGYVFGTVLGTLAGSIQTSHVAIDLRIIDTRTSRILAATSVEGKATDIAGLGTLAAGALGVGLSGYAKTPMEKAVRIAIQEAVNFVVSKTPAQYYRHAETQPVMTTPHPASVPPAPPQAGGVVSPPPPEAVTTPPALSPPPKALPGVYVKLPQVNLREGPGTNFKIIRAVTKGTRLTVLETKNDWHHVRLDDGQDGWVATWTTQSQP